MTDIRRVYQEKDSSLNTDSYDRERFAQLTELSPKLDSLVQENIKENRLFPALLGDMWASLYKMKPTLKELEEGENPANPVNHTLMERILQDSHYDKMRQSTKLDDFSSAIGSMRLNEVVHDWVEQEKAKNAELREQMDQMLNLQKQLESQQIKQETAESKLEESAENGSETEKKKAEKKAQKEQQKSEEISGKLSDLQKQIQQSLQQCGNESFSKAMQKAAQETSEAKENLVSLLGGGSGAGNGEGELHKLPLKDQLDLAETLRNNNKLKQVAEWAGKFKSIARKKQKSKHIESLDRSGMTFGTDVERLLPQELALLKKPETKADFLRRFAEGQTMMYSPKGKETLGKGAIVLCLDQSGSMSELDSQSKGFVLALAMIAKKQRRDFAVVTFSNNVGKIFKYEKGKISPSELVELATYFKGGGTQYAPPLNEASKLILQEKRFKKADILFVTDGEPMDRGTMKNEKWLNEFADFKKATDTNIMSLLLGNDVKKEYVSIFSDKILKAADFADESSHEVFSSLVI